MRGLPTPVSARSSRGADRTHQLDDQGTARHLRGDGAQARAVFRELGGVLDATAGGDDFAVAEREVQQEPRSHSKLHARSVLKFFLKKTFSKFAQEVECPALCSKNAFLGFCPSLIVAN